MSQHDIFTKHIIRLKAGHSTILPETFEDIIRFLPLRDYGQATNDRFHLAFPLLSLPGRISHLNTVPMPASGIF